jgi:hypothetical protein
MGRRRTIAAGVVLASALSLSRAAFAQELSGVGANATSPPTRVDIGPKRPYWGAGDARWFAAVTFETAGISEKSQLDVGFGRPHYQWIGLSTDTALSLRGLQTFGGIRAVAPWGFARFGPRWWTGLGQKLLTPELSYNRAEIDVNDGLKSKYLSLDGEVGFSIRLPIGAIGGLITAYGILGVPQGYYVFEDSLRVIMDPPFVGRARLSYLAPIGDPATFNIGGLAEVIYNPGREYVNVRIGPAVAVSLTHHLEAVASIAISVANPDEIGISGADLGQIGLRYRWATGDLWPEFP